MLLVSNAIQNFLEEILKGWNKKCQQMGIKIDEEYLHALYSYMLRKSVNTFEESGLKVNYTMTKQNI
jgi:hypothetical protein